MKKALIASLATSALVIGAFAMSASAYVFSNYLSVGSTGNDVVALQSFLVSKGFLTMPAGVAEGYFGSLTKAAVVAYQASVSLPSTGYVGPMTVKVLNAGGSTASTGAATCPAGYSCAQTTPVTFACPSGWTCTPLAGTTGGTVTGASTATGITTPGVQGILSVSQGPISNSVANAGQLKVPVLDIRMQAQFPDLSVQSLQLDLGSSTSLYNFVYSNLYLVDPSTGNVLATIALNPSTVVQSGNNEYIVSVTGFNFIVPKGTYKDLVVEADLYNQINNNYTSGCTVSCTPSNGSGQWTIGIDGNGIRAVDGSGVSDYGPSGNGTDAIYQNMTVGQSLITSASASIALDSSTPQANSVGVTNISQGTYNNPPLPILAFDVNAQGDTLHLHQVQVSISNTGSGTVSTAYLYNQSTQVASAAVSGGVAIFSNIIDGTAGASIPANTNPAFTVKVDVSGLLSTVTNPAVITAAVVPSGTIIYNSMDSNITPTGSANGYNQYVFSEGPVFSVGSVSFGEPTGGNTTTAGTTTYKYSATFNINVQAIGEAVNLGLPATSSAAFGSSTTGSAIAQLLQNGTLVSGNTGYDVIASYSAPNGVTLSPDQTSYFTVAQNQSVTIPVTYSWTVVTNTSSVANTYGIQIQGINWFTSSNGSNVSQSTFMKNQSAWRTANSY